MGYRAYPEYKESWVEWFEKCPAHWEVIAIKQLTPVRRGASPRPIQDSKYFDDEGEYSWVRIADVTANNHYLKRTTQRLSALGKSLSVPLEPGSLFLSIAGSVGKPMISNIKCCIHDGFVYFPYFQHNIEFLYYIFECEQAFLGLGKLGTQLNLNTDTVGSIKIGLPPIEEQQKIAQFLGHKTAQIDHLIEKKQELIEKFQEQRNTVITQAVTKGLDRNVLMKAAHGTWFAEIPWHWEVRPLKFCFDFLNQRRIPLSAEERTYMGGNFPYYGASGIIDHIDTYIFSEPTILIAEDGANLLSRSTPLAFEASGKYWVNNHAHILKPADGAYAYWANLLCIIDFSPWITGAAQPKLTKDNLGAILVPRPPRFEQEQIANYINSRVGCIDPMIDANRRAIDSLQEYRTALITAAVTGQIDVRDWQAPEVSEQSTQDKDVA